MSKAVVKLSVPANAAEVKKITNLILLLAINSQLPLLTSLTQNCLLNA